MDGQIDQAIKGCKRNDRTAQEFLYKRFYKAMVTICQRYTGNDEDAVEVLNNSFLKVFMNIGRFDPAKSSLYTWIRTIVINSCIDFTRANKRNPDIGELAEDDSMTVLPEALTGMAAEDILKCIRLLSPVTQAVFNLYTIEGYTHKEIATHFGIKENTSRWHLSEARKQLQEMIHQLNKEV